MKRRSPCQRQKKKTEGPAEEGQELAAKRARKKAVTPDRKKRKAQGELLSEWKKERAEVGVVQQERRTWLMSGKSDERTGTKGDVVDGDRNEKS